MAVAPGPNGVATPPPPVSVHLLMVHGVGRHAPLSSLLKVYQSFRSNLTSAEAPINWEDEIPGWRLAEFEESASPPFLKLVPRVPPPPGGVAAVLLYEVNYSTLAGVVRENHPIDLTTLLVGFDLAVCAARQELTTTGPSVIGGDSVKLARCLQRFSGVLAAATVPVLGLPSLVLRNYTETFVSTFTRFFEDVATFALDKNGEQLISAHLDRTVESILQPSRFATNRGDRFVVAAHSLGSVVVHNFIVRHWCERPDKVPDTVLTFGSPIGLLSWVWLFLDYPGLRFDTSKATGDNYFCWSPVSNGSISGSRKRLAWLNIVNCLDPIATAFPPAVVDLSSAPADVMAALDGGDIVHRFVGRTAAGAVGSAHTEYLNDRRDFLQILLRAIGLRSGKPADLSGGRSPGEHWTVTSAVLLRVQVAAWGAAMAAIVLYCAIVAWSFGDWRTMAVVALFTWPAATVAGLAFFQRLFFGGPTKRIADRRLRKLRWFDRVSFPYRLRREMRRTFGLRPDVDPLAPGPGNFRRRLASVPSFLPTVAAMLLPVAAAAWLTGVTPRLAGLMTPAVIPAVLAFMAYLMCCAAHELVATWRSVLVALGSASPGPVASAPLGREHTAPPSPYVEV